MPAYKFEALDAAGKAATGLLEADNAKAARAQLRAQSLVPLDVALVAAAGTQGQGLRFTRRVFNSTGLAGVDAATGRARGRRLAPGAGADGARR